MKFHQREDAPRVAAVTLRARLALAGCGSGTGERPPAAAAAAPAQRRRSRSRSCPKNLGNPYFDTSDAGGKKAVEEFGGTYAEVGPQTAQPRRPGAVHQHRGPAGHQARS